MSKSTESVDLTLLESLWTNQKDFANMNSQNHLQPLSSSFMMLTLNFNVEFRSYYLLFYANKQHLQIVKR